MVKNINVYSYCEHHFVPIIGRVHVAYFPNGKVIGLSKINRLVQFYSQKPQLQERLTVQIAKGLEEALMTADVAVFMEATHLCVTGRGIQDVGSITSSSHYSGKFNQVGFKNEFLSSIK